MPLLVIAVAGGAIWPFGRPTIGPRCEPMLRFKAGLMVLALAASACTYKHAGKGIVGGLAMTVAGMYVIGVTAEAEGQGNGQEVGIAITLTGILVGLGSLVSAIAGPPPEPPRAARLPERPPLPPAVGDDELRSHKRVARYMAEHGRCDQVLQISMRVEQADPKFHAASFATDETIARCLPPQR